LDIVHVKPTKFCSGAAFSGYSVQHLIFTNCI